VIRGCVSSSLFPSRDSEEKGTRSLRCSRKRRHACGLERCFCFCFCLEGRGQQKGRYSNLTSLYRTVLYFLQDNLDDAHSYHITSQHSTSHHITGKREARHSKIRARVSTQSAGLLPRILHRTYLQNVQAHTSIHANAASRKSMRVRARKSQPANPPGGDWSSPLKVLWSQG
jgi:hypothetical protein